MSLNVHESELELLSNKLIEAELTASAATALKLEIVDQIGSTNEELALRARAGSVHAVALMAEQQTAGRGRQGKPWVSPRGRNVYLTVAWQITGTPQDLAGLSLALGCAIADELETALGCKLQLKWPNDLYVNDRKLGGILVDLVSAASGPMTVLAGIGLNVAMPLESAKGIDQPFTDLSSAIGKSVSRNRVAASVLNGVFNVFSGWGSAGFSAWRGRWLRRDWLRDQSVTVSGAQQLVGIAKGVSEEGALLVETDDGVIPVWGGETSLRRAAGGVAESNTNHAIASNSTEGGLR